MEAFVSGGIQARHGRLLPARVKETAGTDTPANTDKVILLLAEVAAAAVATAAQSAAESLSTDGRNQRAVNAPFLFSRAASTSAWLCFNSGRLESAR